jgi:predicted MFS family arabinose efflux permease
LIGLCFALLGTASASIVHWYLLWFVFALVSQLSKGVVWSAAVSSEFRSSRGMALGTILLGSGAGTIAAPLLAGYLINHLGWKFAYVVMGLGWGSIAWIFCYAYFYGRTDRLHGSVGSSPASADPLPGLSLRASLTSMRLLKLAVAALLGYIMIIGVWVHLIPILGEQGISRDRAIWISGLLGLSAMFGQLGSGLLADRLPGHLVFGALACLPVLTFSLLLMHSTSLPAVIVATLVIGLYGGASSQMYPYLTSRYFGLRAFGRIYSVISVVISIATGLGPLLAAYYYDQTRNYDPLLRSGIPVTLACALLIVWLGRYPQEPAFGRRSDGVPGMDGDAAVASA